MEAVGVEDTTRIDEGTGGIKDSGRLSGLNTSGGASCH